MRESCKKGSYVTKVNFGNQSHAQKYLQITDKDFRWSEDEKYIGDDYSNCKWKNVKGVVYGKCTDNFCKKAHKKV